jgi:putative redox protein
MSVGSLRLEWRGGLTFEGEDSRGFRLGISGDPGVPGAKPSDLMVLSLAACLAYDVVVVLEKKRQELNVLTVSLLSEQDDLPPLSFRRIQVDFEATGNVTQGAADRALELAEKNCPVLASLSPAVEVSTSIAVRPD